MTDPAPRRLAAGVRLGGRYRLERVLGAGGMAVVWRAADEVLGRPVAIKVMAEAVAADTAYLARFAREARLAAGISHPNLVGVFDYSAESERPYLVMEYVDGGSLTARLESGRLSGADVGRWARDLLSALAAVHAAGIVHRDVKPGNVLVGSDARARLTDFGVARLEDSSRLTLAGQVVGTMRYLAPEVVGGADPSPRADLYALGVLLGEATAKVRDGDPRVAELARRLAATEPGERPSGAEQALTWLNGGKPAGRRLEPAARGAATTQIRAAQAAAPRRAPGPWTRTTRVARRRRGGARLAAAAVLGVVLLAVVLAVTSGGVAGSGAAGSGSAGGRSAARLRLDQRLSQLERSVRAAGSP